MAQKDDLQLTDPAVLVCPYGYYAQVHAHPAAARDEGPLGWIIGGDGDGNALRAALR